MDIEDFASDFFSARMALHQNLVAKVARTIGPHNQTAVTEYGVLALIDATARWPAPLTDAQDIAFARHAAAMVRTAMIAAMLQARGRHVTTRQR